MNYRDNNDNSNNGNDAETEKPTIPHAYLTVASGGPLMMYRVLNEACPACGKGANPAKLAIMHENRSQETVQCVRCDYSATRRAGGGGSGNRPNPAFRPMNSGRNPR